MDKFFTERTNAKNVLLALVVIIIIGLPAYFLGANSESSNYNGVISTPILEGGSNLEPAEVDFSPVWKAWNVLNKKYVPLSTSTITSSEDKIWGMIKGLTSSLEDPYTVFLPPVQAEIFAEDISGNFEGVGMEIGIRDQVLTVIAPLQGTPAQLAGLKSGDNILRIDGEITKSITIDEAVNRIRGERGTEVVFTVARDGDGELLEIKVIRDVIEIPTITSELRSDNVFVIELFNFSAVSANLFRSALREFIVSGTNKLIVDLRGNPGGFLEAAVDMASWFLPAGKIVLQEDFGGGAKPKIYRSRGYDVFSDNLEMVVLIDGGSASASEILAGALNEHGVATLVGGTSFGKGSVQELVKITSDTYLKVTIARWLTPLGTSISHGGLTPDILVEVTSEDIAEGRDPQLERALQLLLN
ncbi:S41 family peptidase [Patescibacteria group bacterium]|nr:S41 family peptidase [Patescibacteria group bacterium]